MLSSPSLSERPASNFLHLPPEVRNRIYLFAFADLQLKITQPRIFKSKFLVVFHDSSRRLSRVNKQIRQESLGYLYHNLNITSCSYFRSGRCLYFPTRPYAAIKALQQARQIKTNCPIEYTQNLGVAFKHCDQLRRLKVCLQARRYYDRVPLHKLSRSFLVRFFQDSAREIAVSLQSLSNNVARNLQLGEDDINSELLRCESHHVDAQDELTEYEQTKLFCLYIARCG